MLIALLCLVMMSAGCAKKKHPRASVTPPLTPRIGATETGIASWYGYPYHGRAAANGEIYDMEKMTAAHRTLPFGTWVEVTNLDNGKVVSVRITDRGPFINGRIIDLSKAAARDIEMIGPGIANVRIKIVTEPVEAARTSRYAVQAGAYRDKATAEELRSRLAATFGTATLVYRAGNPPVWRVLVGNEATVDQANELQFNIRIAGHATFVVRLDEP
jgi:rare lipoprotein A